MKISVKQLGSAVLASILAAEMIPAPVFADETEDAHPTEKTETVYTVLNSDGTVDSTTVSSWLHDDDGIKNISEELDLKNVENVKGDEEPAIDGKKYTWNADGNDIWYQGEATRQIPVKTSITYELDGKKISASDLVGKSGKLKITVKLTNTVTEAASINGKTVSIHPTYLAGGMMNVSTDHFKNVSCDQGKIVSDGNNEILVFATVPGLKESMDEMGISELADDLKVSDSIVINADVKDYESGELMMAMTNDFDLEELPSVGNVSELSDGVEQLFDASEQLEDGARQLYDGTTQLKDGIAPLTAAGPQMNELANAADLLNNGATQLQSGVKAYTDGEGALAAGTKQLYGINEGITAIQSQVAPTQGAQNTLGNASARLSAGLKTLKQNVDGIDAAGLANMLAQAKAQLSAMNETLEKDKATVQALNTQLDGAKAAVNQLSEAVKGYTAAVEGVNQQIETAQGTVKADNEKIADYNNKAAELNTSLNSSLDSSAAAINSAITALEQSKASLSADTDAAAINTIDAQIAELKEQAAAISAQKDKVPTLDKLDDLSKVDGSKVTAILAQISQGLSAIDLEPAITAIEGLQTDTSTALTQIESLQTMLGQANIPDNLDMLKTGIDQLSAGADALNTGVIALNAGLDQLNSQTHAALDQVNAGADQLSANNEALNSGAAALAAGTGELSAKKGDLAKLNAGIATLTDAVDQLNTGAGELYDGNVKFVDEGTGKLKAETGTLTSALSDFRQLADRIEDLNAKYTVFSGAPEGATTHTRFVFRTKEETKKDEE